MASTRTNRDVFVSSLVSFLHKYGLDGVDIDWEYPAATDRGGIDADTNNFVLLMSEIQEAFAMENPGWRLVSPSLRVTGTCATLISIAFKNTFLFSTSCPMTL